VTRANESRLDDSGDDQPAYPAMKEALEEHFQDRKGGLSSNAIGYFLRQYAGRVIAGARFEAYGNSNPRQSWRIVILNDSQFKSEKGKVSTLPDHPYHPYHPYMDEHPNPTQNAGNPHSTVAPPTANVRDARDTRDVSPRPDILPEKISVAADDISSHQPLTPPQFAVMAAIKAAGLYGETRERIASACPRMGGGLVKLTLTELVADGLVVEKDGRYAVAGGGQ